ncbi:hypothetical protein AAG906_032312 [Vitis piasezkii]
MSVINMYNTSSLCVVKPNTCIRLTEPQAPSCSFVGRHKGVTCMASAMPVKQVSENLSPYQPILPFEFFNVCMFLSIWGGVLGAPPPLCFSISVFEALGSLKFPYVYSDPESRRLHSDYILAGCGADELIDLIMRCVLDPGDKVVDCPPTFTMYEFDAAVNGALVLKVPRNSDLSLNVELIADVVQKEKPKCIFLTSPNNPDESIINDEILLKILDLPILVVLDEAYIEFSGIKSRMGWVKKFENLIVLRTFSKRAGMISWTPCGIWSISFSVIGYLWRAKQPYNVSVAAEVSACAALLNPTYLEKVEEALVQEQDRLYKLLKEVPFLNPFPSYSNFILCEVMSGMDAKKLKDDLAKMGVMIRHYNNKELKGYVRVSVGKPEHTDALMACLNSLD